MPFETFKKFVIAIILIALISQAFVFTTKSVQAALNPATVCAISTFVRIGLQVVARAIVTGVAYGKLRTASALIPYVGLAVHDALPAPDINFGEIAAKDILGAYARCIGRVLLDNTISALLSKVRTLGPDGGASWITNWRTFQTKAAYRGESLFRGILANTPVCDYLRSQIDSAFRVTAKSKISLANINLRVDSADPFTLTGKCTLPQGFDLAKYNQDFAGQGGWAAFERLLEPQNNPIGLALLAQDELAKQRAAEQLAANTAAQSNSGYQGTTTCKTRAEDGSCAAYNDIKTPGSQFNSTINAIAQTELNRITNIQNIDDLVVNFITARLVARLENLGAGESDPAYGSTTVPDFSPSPNYTLPPLPSFSPGPGTGPAGATPTPTTPTPGGAPGCFPNPDAGSAGACSLLCNGGTQGDFTGAIRSASVTIANDGSGTLDPNDAKSDSSFRIINHDAWMNKLVASLGSGARIDTDQEINIKNGGSSEQYLVSTSNGYTASRLRASGCP